MTWFDSDGRELTRAEMNQLFNPFYDIEFLYRHGLVFLDLPHLRAYENLTPEKLRDDLEWASTVYILTMDTVLRDKVACHLKPRHHDINWDGILATDFGSGHYAAVYWAFGLWSGRSWGWGGWEDNDGKKIPIVDTISRSFSMDSRLRFIALVATAFCWGLKGNIPG
ncbi:MAG: hypothetical protein A4E56_00381 [Pelotomaculum sp. PtaU1.Bin065]|nr:MAG: hypothetical protein A4E56_00381 [Pelotomaculum sp. PtaU1.Bin065]